MSDFRLQIQTDNAAFGETLEDVASQVARILRRVAEEIERAGLADDPRRVRDANGNTVGRYQHSES
jgi:GTP cyclohydrolase I